MPGYNHQLDEVTSPSSEYSFGAVSMVPSSDMYSIGQTGPSADHLGSPWVTTKDGQQYMSVDAEEYSLTWNGAPTPPHGAELDFAEDFRTKCASPLSESGKRLSSRSPGVSAKRRNTKPMVSKAQTRIAPAPTASRMSNMGLTGNAALPFQTASGHFMGVSQPLFQEPDHVDPLPPQMYYEDLSLDLDMPAVDGLSYHNLNTMHVNPTHMQFNPDASLTATSTPQSWTASFTPPQSPPEVFDNYSSQASSSDSAGSSPAEYGHRQSYGMTQDLSLQGLSSGDLTAAMVRDDSFSMSSGSRRSRMDGETARDHHLYKNAAPGADGLFHCPWEGTPECHHKPEKLKCNYDKFVDSHLRPYRCKVESCADARFSSTACLLRHEREAHRMHGHQAYNCTYAGCERSQEGKGFPRAWNLKDHMRRVHNDHGNGPLQGSMPADDQQSKARRKNSKSSNSSSRKSSKSTAVAEPSPVDQMEHDYMEWDESYKSLQGIIQQLGRPTDPESRRRLKKAQKYLEQMSTVYERVSDSHRTNIAPAHPRRHTHGD